MRDKKRSAHQSAPRKEDGIMTLRQLWSMHNISDKERSYDYVQRSSFDALTPHPLSMLEQPKSPILSGVLLT